REAERSLDIQYYIFVEDDTGKLLLAELLRAADRGVRVRLLIDDLNSYGKPETRATLAAISKHDKIDVRLFKPFAYRGDVLLLHRMDQVLNAPRINHRMHNKLMVVDGAVALVGGRNVADEYFGTGAGTVRFADFDVAAFGPVVPEPAKGFDAYWNCALAIPQEAVAPIAAQESGTEAHAVLRENLGDADLADLANRVEKGDPLRGMLGGELPLAWANAVVAADPPEKATRGSNPAVVSPTAQMLNDRMQEVVREFVVISPYFIPGPAGLAVLEDLRKRGARVRVVTNSLASTDVPVVHSAYRRYRPPLLDAGVEIFEVRPVHGQPRTERATLGGGSGGSGSGAPFALHAKAYVFDR